MKTPLPLSFLLLFISPFLHAQFTWEHTGGPDGGNFSRLYYNDQYAFFPDQYYLYRTTDGINWEKLPESDLFPIATYGSSMVAQQWHDNTYQYLPPVKFKISHDNGVTWSEGTMPPGLETFEEVALCSHGIYIRHQHHDFIFHSKDDGLTWDTLNLPTASAFVIRSFDNKLYIIGNAGTIWRTNTNGENWTEVIHPSPEYVKVIFAHSPHILLGTQSKLWHSHDDGQTWAAHETPEAERYKEFVLVGNTLYALGGTTNLARSEDFGITWEALPGDYDTWSLYGLASAGGNMLTATYNRGVYRWDEASQALIEANQNLSSATIYTMTVAGGKIWAGTGNGTSKYDEQQQNWSDNTLKPTQVPYYIESVAAGNNGLVCASGWLQDTLYLSTDSGATWKGIPFTKLTGSIWDWGYFGKVHIIDDVIFVGSEFDGQFRSADLGETWQPSGIWVNWYFHNLFKFNDLLWTHDLNHIYTSSDLGLTWNLLTDFPAGFLHSIYAGGNLLFAITLIQINNGWYSMLYVSQDGIHWKYAHNGLPVKDFGTHVSTETDPVFFEYQGKYYAYDSYYGLYSTNDTCKTWFPAEALRFHRIVQSDSLLYAGGWGGGVIRSVIPTNLYQDLIGGIVFQDANNNGMKDAGEPIMPDVRVSLDSKAWSSFYFTNTNANGEFEFTITPGYQDTLRPLVNSPYLESINPPYYLADSSGSGKNFGIYLTPGINDLSVTTSNSLRPRPGFHYPIMTCYANKGSTEQEGVVSLKLDSHLIFLEATPAPSAIFGDSLVWNVGQIPVFESGNIVVKTKVPDTTALGIWLKNSWRITSSANDQAPENNLAVVCDTIASSFNPNEKRVFPAEGLTAQEIRNGKEILYTINFQNTGAFLAERVRITDLLDTALTLTTLRFVAASHPVTSFELKPGGLLEVIFENIQLPDSTSDEPGSHGFVTFAVQRNKAFNQNYPVRNYAAIYFDFNEPIFTNEVSFKVKQDETTAVHEIRENRQQELLVFPNPAQAKFTVSSGGKLQGTGRLTLLNAVGQVCRSIPVANLGAPVQVETEGLAEGVYFIQLTGWRGSLAGRVVVQN